MSGWIAAVPVAEFDDEDIMPFSHGGRLYAVCLDDDGRAHCVAGHCPHDGAALAGGVVVGHLIECPMNGCRFDLATGRPQGGPSRLPLPVFPARIARDTVEIQPG